VLRGRWAEAIALVERGLADARARRDGVAEARLRLRRGRARVDEIRHHGGDPAPALADLEAAHAGALAAADPRLLADCVDALGMRRFVQWFATRAPADLAAAEQPFREALALRAPAGDSAGLAESWFHVGLIHQMRDERAAAGEAFTRAREIATRVDDPLSRAHAVRHLAYLAELRGDGAAAEAMYRESLALFVRLGPGPGVVAAQLALAELRYARDGDAARALPVLTRILDDAAAVQSAAYVALASAALARVHRDAGQADAARRRLVAAIAAMTAIDRDDGVPEAYEQLALIDLLEGDPAAAEVDVEHGLASQRSPRLEALLALARRGHPTPRPSATASASDAPAAEDPVVRARRALAAGDAEAALAAAIAGDDPDTLLLAARAVGPAAAARAITAAAAMSRAQERRFERVLAAARPSHGRP